MTTKKNQLGFAPVIAIVVVVGIIGALGYIGLRALNKDKSIEDMTAKKIASITASKECMDTYNDTDLCKFFNSWNSNQKFKLDSTTTFEGETSKSIMAIDGDRSYYWMEGDYIMETVVIADTTYTKAGETWWKYTSRETDPPVSIPTKDDFKFNTPNENSEEDLTQYVNIGKEMCGDLSCFKYQIVDTSDTETAEYIWFDETNYLIRRTLTEGSDGSKSESVFSYDNISVETPSPVKELAPNQYIVPGLSEPQNMPEMMN